MTYSDGPRRTTGVSKRGFASMDPERQREIARKGGASLKPEQRSFSKDRALAKKAGRKGGLACAKKPTINPARVHDNLDP